MRKRLLIFAWEYHGYHSDRGSALSRRVSQVAESFNLNGWEVIVIHKDHRNECNGNPFLKSQEKDGLTRIAVKLERDIEDFNKIVFVRKFETLYYITFFGDRSYYWANEVIANFDKFGIDVNPDYIISFYTPRVTLYLGKYFSKKLGIPWIADLQDPIYQGISRMSRFFCKLWIKNVLKTAKSIVQVSPEWAENDGKEINRSIATIRHAVPTDNVKIDSNFDTEFKKHYGNAFNVFYGGSLSPKIQSLDKLKKLVEYANSINIKINILIAGNQTSYIPFKEKLGEKVAIHLGWLDAIQMNEYIYNCNCTLVIPWSKNKIGIPSKFYEFCSYNKPIWVIGDDIGGFNSLLNEWKHPKILINDLEYQKKAFLAAVNNNDYSYMFNMTNCEGTIIRANGLYNQYEKLL